MGIVLYDLIMGLISIVMNLLYGYGHANFKLAFFLIFHTSTKIISIELLQSNIKISKRFTSMARNLYKQFQITCTLDLK